MFNSLRPHELYSPWNSPGQNTGVGSLSLLQGIFPTQESNQGLLHCGQILYQLSYRETLYYYPFFCEKASLRVSFLAVIGPGSFLVATEISEKGLLHWLGVVLVGRKLLFHK